ncbi:MAG: HAD family hydrolase [bacterium]|nr:HAD family hydrolase [bacterium]
MIKAVVFDLGGTLEEIYYDDATRQTAAGGLLEMLAGRGLDPGLSVEDLRAAVLSGMAAYQRWREQHQRELPPDRVWTEYVFPDNGLPRDRLIAEAEDLTLYYEDNFYGRTLRPEAPAVLAELQQRGFRLAVISNILSLGLVPRKLASYGIARFFDPVITSSGFGYRKPHPRIFHEAAAQMGLPPEACAYVGDTVSRDVAGAQGAGYGLAIQIRSFLTDKSDGDMEEPAADVVIRDLREIIAVVTGPIAGRGGQGAVRES